MEKIKTMYSNPKEFLKENMHCLWLLYLPCYLFYFARLQQRTVPVSELYIIETHLDRMIPTIPAFFIPYALWWFIFPGAFAFFLFWGTRKDFLKLCFILFGGYTICLAAYTIWPNGLMLREPLESSDIFSMGINWLRTIDPPRNVCPSMHVSSTVAIDLVVRECRYIKLRYKNIETIIAVLICLSTMFIKQHSVIDVILGWAMSVLLWFIWKRFFEK